MTEIKFNFCEESKYLCHSFFGFSSIWDGISKPADFLLGNTHFDDSIATITCLLRKVFLLGVDAKVEVDTKVWVGVSDSIRKSFKQKYGDGDYHYISSKDVVVFIKEEAITLLPDHKDAIIINTNELLKVI